MPRINNNKEEKKAKFEEFKFTGKKFEYSGRLFQKKEGKGKVKSRSGFTLDINGLISIKGCELVVSEDNYFITWPGWYKDKEHKGDFIYIDKELNEEIDELAEVIYKKIF